MTNLDRIRTAPKEEIFTMLYNYRFKCKYCKYEPEVGELCPKMKSPKHSTSFCKTGIRAWLDMEVQNG